MIRRRFLIALLTALIALTALAFADTPVCPNPDCPNPGVCTGQCENCPNATCPNPDCPNPDCPKQGTCTGECRRGEGNGGGQRRGNPNR